MDRALYIAMTGAKHTLGQQGAVAHNLANVDSTGFRNELHKLRAVEVQYAADSTALPTRAFVTDASVATDFTPGPLKLSGRPYDVAIEGKGWFSIQMPDGTEAYTRDGSFALSQNGLLQTRSGLPVMAQGGTITIPPDAEEVMVGKDGTVSVRQPGGVVEVLGQLRLVNPPEPDLVRGGDGYFRQRNGAPAQPDPNVQVAGGYLESSNVNVVDQLVSMISLARQFEMQTKMITNLETNDRAGTQVLSYR
jgi:flagellar basal-body rod protein FlgF